MKVKEKIHVMSSYENTMVHKERFNPYQCGTGVHATEKHPTRARSKKKWKKEAREFY